MDAALVGQVLCSQAPANLIADRLPAGISLCVLESVLIRDLASTGHISLVAHPELRQDFEALLGLEAT